MASDDYPFNDEFLLTERDREVARMRYDRIFPALDHDELRKVFTPLDERANTAKRKSRKYGAWAVGLVAAAFMCVASGEIFFELPDDRVALVTVAIVSAVLSLVGAALGIFGVLFANTKKEWLENRFLTERMRQFHFQTLMVLAPDIMAAAASGQWKQFLHKRDTLFAAFRQDVIARKSSLFSTTVSEVEIDGWIVPYSEPSIADDDVSKQFFEAYRQLRITRQIAFADYKLQTTRRFLSPFPRDQAARLGGLAMACVLGLLVLHLLSPIVFLKLWSPKPLSLIATALAIFSLTMRTFEEGLRPGREVERYRAYQSALRSIGRRFDEGAAPSAKLKAMASLEVLSYNEMVNFLKSNHEARFVM